MEKLAEMATPAALEKLRQAKAAHEKRLVEAQQSKTGHNALVGVQKKRIGLLQKLIADCERHLMTKKEEK